MWDKSYFPQTVMLSHNNVWVGEKQQVWMSAMVPTGWRGKAEEKQQKQDNNTEWENWRERWRQEWIEGGLAGVGRGTLPDHCKKGGVGQVSHQLQPWPSSLLLSISHTLSASFNHPPPASHPPLVPLLCSYKSISSPSPLPSLPSPTFPLPLHLSLSLPLSLSALLFIPCHSSLSFHRWKCSGSRKVRGGQTRGRERGRGNKGVWKWESECI